MSINLKRRRLLIALLAAAALSLITGVACSGSQGDSPIPSTSRVQVGILAPDFTASDFTGKSYSLSEYRGQKVLLVFYMGYFCGGCREQLTQLAKGAQELKNEAVLLAVSADPPSESVKMNQLINGAFPLISDTQLKIIRSYDAEMTNMATPMADYWYFIIDKEGKIRERISDPLFGQHWDSMLSNLKKVS